MKVKLIIIFIIITTITGCNQKNTAGLNIAENVVGDKGERVLPALACGATVCKVPSRNLALQSNAPEYLFAASGGYDDQEMKIIPGGTFQMGSNDFDDTKPLHQVSLKPFLMDEHEVTNAQFEKFVKATGYVTIAERPLNPKDFPGVPVEKLVPGSAVFTPTAHPVSLSDAFQWWVYKAGANWKHPAGPGSSVKGKDTDPVVQVCYEDATAYAKWAGKRLPTEAEWEFAARAGRKAGKYYWGNELKPNGKWVANIYQGSFPDHNTKEDGYSTVAPVKSFPANPFGLYDMDGNVWEWCHDFYRPDFYLHSPGTNPQGPSDSFDPEEPGATKHVQRGGSFICSDQYCIRYKAGSRGKGESSSAGNNLGFRCVKDIKEQPIH